MADPTSTDKTITLPYATGTIVLDTTNQPLSFTIMAPANGDEALVIKAPAAMTTVSGNCAVSAATNATIDIYECLSTDVTSCTTILSAPTPCTTASGGVTLSLADTAIASGAWIKVAVTAAPSGTPKSVNATLIFHY